MSRHPIARVPKISVLLEPSKLWEGRDLQVPSLELKDPAYLSLGQVRVTVALYRLVCLSAWHGGAVRVRPFS